MEAPWLSVIVPSHYGERWLKAALQSIADQNEPGIETIVVDGSDADTSVEIAETFSGTLNLRSYRLPDLRPWTAKTNFGVQQARSAHICILHQDDLWLPRRASEAMRWIDAQPNGVMHLHPAYIIDEAATRRGVWRCPLPPGQNAVASQMLLERLLIQNFIAIPTPVIRRDAFLGVGGLDDQLWYTADWDLYLKLLAGGDVYSHPEPLACFRIHRDSQTVSGSRNVAEFRQQMEVVVDRHATRLPLKSRAASLRAARLSIMVHSALAAAGDGKPAGLVSAGLALLGLGPSGIFRYFRASRIVERTYPRLRAR